MFNGIIHNSGKGQAAHFWNIKLAQYAMIFISRMNRCGKTEISLSTSLSPFFAVCDVLSWEEKSCVGWQCWFPVPPPCHFPPSWIKGGGRFISRNWMWLCRAFYHLSLKCHFIEDSSLAWRSYVLDIPGKCEFHIFYSSVRHGVWFWVGVEYPLTPVRSLSTIVRFWVLTKTQPWKIWGRCSIHQWASTCSEEISHTYDSKLHILREVCHLNFQWTSLT